MSERTLIFCTAYAAPNEDPYYSWDVRYRVWLEAIRRSGLEFDQILLVDDGSEQVPAWPDVAIINDGEDLVCDAPVALFHFRDHVGRRAISDFPGWVRSFFFASRYAEANNFARIVHIEADAFLLSARAQTCINDLHDGWTALWCARHGRPESGIQVIAGAALQTFRDWAAKPVEDFSGLVIETTLPFTRIERDLVGDRYSEAANEPVPPDADWCMQANPIGAPSPAAYFWWLPWISDVLAPDRPGAVPTQRAPLSRLDHPGLYYLDAMAQMAEAIEPRTYFEIGTHTGESLKMMSCDAVCVDPQFLIATDVLKGRRSTHFFQGTSDAFFADRRLAERLMPDRIDLAFLDGLHLFETLLSDFIHTERLASQNAVVLLHDCLPLNARMAERERRFGDADEPAAIREFWTGDVWKVLVILKHYRPDLGLYFLDCPPTGLIACTGLDGASHVLADNYDRIVRDYAGLSLETYGLERLWSLYPTLPSRQAGSYDLFRPAVLLERAA